jgi:hypothetical protein
VPEDNKPSERVVEQRLRNRVMEALETLADGDPGVLDCGAGEYFNQFYDWIDDDSPWEWREWGSLTLGEVEALDKVLELMNAACEATPQYVTEDELITSGWPTRIQPFAATALQLMRDRGWFDEDAEEAEPSLSPL